MILADSSIWQDALRTSSTPRPWTTRFAEEVRERRVVYHPWVLGELLLGGINPVVASRIQDLDVVPVASEADVHAFIRKYRPRGIGWVDVHLLVSCLESGALLWTQDKALHAHAELHGRAMIQPLSGV